MIFTSFLLFRGIAKGRVITDLFDDLADFYVAAIGFDYTAMKDVLARSGTSDAGTAHIKGSDTTSANGHLTDAELVELPFAKGQRLAPSAASAAVRMNDAYKNAFGSNIVVTDSYRSYDEQVSTRAAKGAFAARPGTSRHGLGIALDLGGGIDHWSSAQRKWMVKNAPGFGWTSPAWAQQGQDTPEPWHWEFG